MARFSRLKQPELTESPGDLQRRINAVWSKATHAERSVLMLAGRWKWAAGMSTHEATTLRTLERRS